MSDPIHMGYGLGIQEIGGLLGHTGGIMGYGSVLMLDPETGATLVVIANLGDTTRSLGGGIIFGEIADLLFPAGLAALVPPPSATPVP